MSSVSNSSSSATSGKTTDDKQEDNKELPVVDGILESFETPHLATTADKGQAAIQRHAATIRKLKEQEREIAEQHEKLQDMIDALESRKHTYMELESRKHTYLLKPRVLIACSRNPSDPLILPTNSNKRSNNRQKNKKQKRNKPTHLPPPNSNSCLSSNPSPK